MILFMHFEMFGKVLNPRTKQCYLNFGGSGIILMRLVAAYYFLFLSGTNTSINLPVNFLIEN